MFEIVDKCRKNYLSQNKNVDILIKILFKRQIICFIMNAFTVYSLYSKPVASSITSRGLNI